MDYLEHEYLVPVIVGNRRYADLAVRKLYNATKIKPHIFAEKFSLLQRIFACCHRVSPMKQELLFESLIAFAESLEEYRLPVIICDCEQEELLRTKSDAIECFYIIKRLDELR